MLLRDLEAKGLIHPPAWLTESTAYLTIMGSMAYGVASDASDWDVYGFCMPPKETVFPHLAGEIPDFGIQKQRFGQWQEHHIIDKSRQREYDFVVYSIVKFFHLAMTASPNIVDSLFVPDRCILHRTPISDVVRENRHLFLHAGCFHTFRGYAYAQLNKIKNKTNSSNPKRAESIATFGMDLKFCYHTLRLCLECEQILAEGELDLERNTEILKSVRRGEWTLEAVEDWLKAKFVTLDELYARTKLPHSPDEATIKSLLLSCLEMHFGSLSEAVNTGLPVEKLVTDIRGLLAKFEKHLS